MDRRADHADPSTAYLSRPVNGTFEIEKWITGDHVLWMRGRYVQYTNYNTEIRMCVAPVA
jgi:hypothetical protein